MKTKLYCYVDESGQDTKGKLFIAVAIVVEKDRDELSKKLETIERNTRKRKVKWNKTQTKVKISYLERIQSLRKIKGKIFYKKFQQTKEYQELTNITIARAINRYNTRNAIKNYKATIIIDGLRKTERLIVSKSLRELGIKIRKVRGTRDGSSSLVRLADAIAGLIREKEQKKSIAKKINRLLREKDVIIELK